MRFEIYWKNCGISATDVPDAGSAAFAAAVGKHQAALQALCTPEALTNIEVQWSFRVPELGDAGACSLFGQLAEQPYDLTEILGGRTAANRRLLAEITAIVQYYREHSRSQWFGVYQSRLNVAGEPVLVKLAYFGAESRAEFPLTAEFAKGSNNSAVGLSGQGRLINDVNAYVAEGGGYYTCDPKVKSEACLPLFGANNQLVGILDSEAFERHFFVGEELALLIAVATTLSSGVFAAPPTLDAAEPL